MESNWRTNVWRLNFDPLIFRLIARLPPTIGINAYIGDENPGAALGNIYFALPTILPFQVAQFNRVAPHFPYGMPVDPD